MNTAILIIALFIFGLILKPKRDWFVVEIRSCLDDKFIGRAFHYERVLLGFDREFLKSSNLKIDIDRDSKTDFVFKQDDEDVISVQQLTFDNASAALMFFERLAANNQKLNPNINYRQVYLRRIVTRFRLNATTIPPKQYVDKDGEILRQWPEELKGF